MHIVRQRASGASNAMTNKIAIGLGLVILVLIAADWYFFDHAKLLFLLKKLADMIEWMAFWR